jgi:polysaccharide deacetylase family protein (PEP-CTERM system associated)
MSKRAEQQHVAFVEEEHLYRLDSPVNAMTVDVEDYFHVSAFESVLRGRDWSEFECRIPRNLEAILQLFSERRVSATFFVLGWVAERFPQLVRRVAAEGHEVASHGMRHVRVTHQTPQEFRADAAASRALLEDTIGAPVKGYRAASYSIGASNLWAHDVLGETGYRYSSSIYPIRHDLYGMPEAPRFPFRFARDGLLEIPVTTLLVGGRRVPCGGGGFFRLFPYCLSRWAMRRVNQRDRQPAVFYFHPWEIDPEQPRVVGASLKSRFRHYFNLERTRGRLQMLLADFPWDRMDRVFLRG